jgi:hypothetical protein
MTAAMASNATQQHLQLLSAASVEKSGAGELAMKMRRNENQSCNI